MPKMKHPAKGSRQIEVAPDMVAMYESQGWRKATPKKTTSSTDKPSTSDAK